ncbi:MAG: hypothetical protein K9L62_10390 [Vallitaleaceae bacterium]|nr:hypothetical protein [Vallitaleaceae bacterium]
MSYPKNPNTIVIKNRFYPQGLTELDIWSYYDNVKGAFLQATKNRDLTALIMIQPNKPILRRNLGGKTIRLTPQNYDQIITGRTVGFYSSMTSMEQIGIIDIDVDPRDGLKWAKQTTLDVFDFVMDKMPLVRKANIIYTGKTSFHVVCDFGKKMKIDSIRFLLQKFLRNSELSNKYTIEAKRRPGIPNLDLSPNKIRGNYITLHSLSLIGLKCMEVNYNQIISFDPRKTRIK